MSPARAPAPRVAPAWHHTALTLAAPRPFSPLLAPEVLRSALGQTCARHGEVGAAGLHCFQPQGASLWVSGPRFLLTLHTWPERGLATLDVLGPEGETAALVEALLPALGLAVVERRASRRGG